MANASQLTAQTATGTGEHDYAFLIVTSTTNNTPVPAAFPALPMTAAEPDVGDTMLLAAYPAGFLDGITIEKNLYPSSAYAAVTKLFTFGEGYDVDLVSVGGTVVSQGGSSGGAVVRQSGKLSGLISTATPANTTAERDLRAITLAHIDRSLATHGAGGIVSLLSKNLTEAAAEFASTTGLSEKEMLLNVLK